MGSAWGAFENITTSAYIGKYLAYVFGQAIGVYFNLYFLIPRFLERRRYTKYLIYLLLTVIVIALLIIVGYYLSAYFTGKSITEIYKIDAPVFQHLLFKNTLPSTVATMGFAMSIKLAKNYLEAQHRQQELEREKLGMELQFLKLQLSPHFLFNTINSIFVLIHKSPDMASESLAKFSHLLRYQLYECDEQQIPLSKEIAYLENFVELEQLRQDQHLTTQIDIAPLRTANLMIAPFLLVPFVENAFKHISQWTDRRNWIDIQLTWQDNKLHMRVANSYEEKSINQLPVAKKVYPGGIGLKNVKRRLNLLYPNQHLLVIDAVNQVFSVELELKLGKGADANSIPAGALTNTY